MKKIFLFVLIAIAAFAFACEKKTTQTNTTTDKKTPGTQLTKDGYVPSETGTEKAKPAPGKANVQGKALFNEKPAAGVEAKLCEKFNTITGCSGQQHTTKTDENGEYLFKDIESKDYEGLLVKVFETPSYIFAAQSLGISAAKYKFEADKTFFAPATNLFKSDLKAQSPKANAKVDGKTLEVKWEAYPEAAYYKIGLYSDNPKVISPYINHKVEANSFKAEKPLVNGEYRLKIDAYNANDIRLSQLKEDLKLTITGGEELPVEVNPAPANK